MQDKKLATKKHAGKKPAAKRKSTARYNGSNSKEEQQSIIGLLASHDSTERNDALAGVLEFLEEKNPALFRSFHFVFTGGTYDRIVLGRELATDNKKLTPVKDRVRDTLMDNSTRLPSREGGGVTLLAHMVVQRRCSIVWPFFSPVQAHWLRPENLALMRLCDQWHVKRLMNSGSVLEWFFKEGDLDVKINRQSRPREITLPARREDSEEKGSIEIEQQILAPTVSRTFDNADLESMKNRRSKLTQLFRDRNDKTPQDMRIALIAHDEMKARMVDFAIDYEHELSQFELIMSTRTTGTAIKDATSELRENLYGYHSGPKGGDIEIATEIIAGRCDVVIFFIDPLHSHPHIEDIRVVLAACMIQDNVIVFTHEMQARQWMDRVIRRPE